MDDNMICLFVDREVMGTGGIVSVQDLGKGYGDPRRGTQIRPTEVLVRGGFV
jgi:hypothetical protein